MFGLSFLYILLYIKMKNKERETNKPILVHDYVDKQLVESVYYKNFINDKSNFRLSSELREMWIQGIKTGIEVGLYSASLEGQRIELTNNTTNPKHIEFLEKHYALCAEYNVAIQYHPKVGMCIINQKPNYL